MFNLFTQLSRRRFPYEPLITVEISKNNLLNNLEEFKKIAPCGSVAPVLKSNAYGHGLIEIASIIEKNIKRPSDGSIPFFIVDSYFEALSLRSKGIKTKLLIIGYTRPEVILTSHLRYVSYTITDLSQLQRLAKIKHPVAIHLKIDTGMHRQGILEEEIDQALEIISNNSDIVLKGICSHLSDADNPDPSFTEAQINIWNRITGRIKTSFPTIEFLHLSATAGHRYTKDIDANVSRVGLGLYGLIDGDFFASKLNLKPVLSMKTIITGIKNIKCNDIVGYGNTFKADRAMRIATIPVGYYEGIDRLLSNNGMIEVGDERISCPIIGRVSMNITCIDISGKDNINIGSTAIVISNIPTRDNSIQSICSKISTIPYEIVVKIPAHLKRKIIE